MNLPIRIVLDIEREEYVNVVRFDITFFEGGKIHKLDYFVHDYILKSIYDTAWKDMGEKLKRYLLDKEEERK